MALARDDVDEPSRPTAVYRAATHAECVERAVVLEMGGIRSEIAATRRGYELLVDASRASAAAAELARYEDENRAPEPEPAAAAPLSNGRAGAIAYAAVLVLVHVLAQIGAFGLDWRTAGMAHAGLIGDGQWWRTLTALSLHADVAHLAGNAALGGLFGLLAARRFGEGVAWCGIVSAGALGNAVNAVVQPAAHASIGASTAVFGALGILAAHTWRAKGGRRERAAHRWAPIVSGVVLLAWLGTAGERTDVVAHLTGFGSGVLLGSASAALRREWLVRRRLQLLLGLVALALPTVAWILASSTTVVPLHST